MPWWQATHLTWGRHWKPHQLVPENWLGILIVRFELRSERGTRHSATSVCVFWSDARQQWQRIVDLSKPNDRWKVHVCPLHTDWQRGESSSKRVFYFVYILSLSTVNYISAQFSIQRSVYGISHSLSLSLLYTTSRGSVSEIVELSNSQGIASVSLQRVAPSRAGCALLGILFSTSSSLWLFYSGD
jgi:hypothetical protein